MAYSLRRRPQAKGIVNIDSSKRNITAKGPEKGLLLLQDLPEWARDNEYIYTGYRQISSSVSRSIQSCFYIHNETGNVYTHFLAAIWMIILPAYSYPQAKERYSEANYDDWVVFALFFLGGFICFGFSVIYHVLSNHSHRVHVLCLRLDLFGITAVTAGCFPPGVWYTFPCANRHAKMFWISVDLIAQVTAAIAIFFVPKFRQRSMKPLRGFVFSFMASSAFYPIIYASFQHGYQQMDVEAGASRYFLTVLIYLTAVTAYVTKIPEAWKPGSFDIWGQSHTIFHILMAVGLTIHFSAFAKAFDYVHTLKKC